MRGWVVVAAVLSCSRLLSAATNDPALAPTGGVAAIEQQLADVNRLLRGAEQKQSERVKCLEELKTLVDLKAASAKAECDLQAYAKSPDFLAPAAALDEARAALAAVIEEARKTDPGYADARKKLAEAMARKSAPDMTEAALAAIDKEIAACEKRKAERRKALDAKPAVAAAAAKAKDAESALQALLCGDAYRTYLQTRDETAQAYQAARAAAIAADADYAAAVAAANELRIRRDAIAKEVAALKAAPPPPPPPTK